MSAVVADLRHATRVLARHPGPTAIAIFTLALAIGGATAIFSVVYGVLLRPLPFPSPDRLTAIWEVNHSGTYSRLADPNFADFRDRSQSFSVMAKYSTGIVPVSGAGEPARATVATVTRDFFGVLGIQPARGRGFGVADARVGAAPVAIVSHRFWVDGFGSTPTLTDLRLRIDDRTYAVVGVMPAGFQFPASVDLWVPAELTAENTSRTSHNFRAIGRLRDGVSVASAGADLSRIAQDIIRQSSEQGDYLMTDAAAVPLLTSLTSRVSSTLYILLGAVFVLLLIACANVTNLLLAQAAARQRELAIRQALGAGRRRLVRQFVAEAFLLLLISCAAGVLLALGGVNVLLALAPPDLPRLDDVAVSWPVLGFAAGLSALVAAALGVFTALRASARDSRPALADGGRHQAGGATTQRIGRMIVTVQVALTVVLLVGAALLGRSLLQVLSVDPGFRTEGLIAMDVAVPYSDDPAAKARLTPFYDSLMERLRAIPGVEQVAATSAVPLAGGHPDGMFAIVAPQHVPTRMDDLVTLFRQTDATGTADYCAASPGYFEALGIPLVRGRMFDQHDAPDAAHVAVINRALARSRWPDADPIGRTIEFGNMDGDLRLLTIVGIVGDTRDSDLERPPRPTVYVNLRQRPVFDATVVLQARNSGPAIAAARRVLKEAAPDVPPRFRTFEDIYAASFGARRFNLLLVGAFAGTALLLAMAGIYGVMAYIVTQRRKEMGVRAALGATPRQLFSMVIGQGLRTTAIGAALGVGAALGLTRTLGSLLFGVTPTDPAAFAAVIGVLGAVAAIACYVPARRATRTDPLDALRRD